MTALSLLDDGRPRAYVSCTAGLEPLRDEVMRACEDAGLTPFESWQARGEGWTQEHALAEITSASVYIGVLGTWYGDLESDGGRSMVDVEFEHALDRYGATSRAEFSLLLLIPDASSEAMAVVDGWCSAAARARFNGDPYKIDADRQRHEQFMQTILLADLQTEPHLRFSRRVAQKSRRLVVLYRRIDEIYSRLFIEFQNHARARGLSASRALREIERLPLGDAAEGLTSSPFLVVAPPLADDQGATAIQLTIQQIIGRFLRLFEAGSAPGVCLRLSNGSSDRLAALVDAVMASNDWDADRDPHVVRIRNRDAAKDLVWRALWAAAGVPPRNFAEPKDPEGVAAAIRGAGRPSVLVVNALEQFADDQAAFETEVWSPVWTSLRGVAEREGARGHVPLILIATSVSGERLATTAPDPSQIDCSRVITLDLP
jgi:hypothetical protein